MKWVLPGDLTPPIITAKKHIASGHGGDTPQALPETCVLFEMGMALGFIESRYPAVTIADRLPCFIADSKCIALEAAPGVGFVNGGFGAPAGVDTLETMLALGVKRVVVAGMCGGFGEQLRVGDVVIPAKILSEEGTSRHYVEDAEFAVPDAALFARAVAFFGADAAVSTAGTVTSDSFYRQTFAKEAFWRAQGCVGVDMESSALLAVSRYYGVPAVSVLICSDKHPLAQSEADWGWGDCDFRQVRRRFVERVVAFSVALQQSMEDESK